MAKRKIRIARRTKPWKAGFKSFGKSVSAVKIPRTALELLVLTILLLIVYAGYIAPLAGLPRAAFVTPINSTSYGLQLVIGQLEDAMNSTSYGLRMVIGPITGVLNSTSYLLTLGAEFLMPETGLWCVNPRVEPVGPVNWDPSLSYTFSIDCYVSVGTISNVYFKLTRTDGGVERNLYWPGGGVYKPGNTSSTDALILPAGVYRYNWTATDTAGNTVSTQNYEYVIYKNQTILNLTLNGVEGNLTVSAGSIVNASAISNNPAAKTTIFVDGTWVIDGSAPSILLNTTLISYGLGVHNISAYNSGNENWTNASAMYRLTVTGVLFDMWVVPPSPVMYNPTLSHAFFAKISGGLDEAPKLEINGTNYSVTYDSVAKTYYKNFTTAFLPGNYSYRWWAKAGGAWWSSDTKGYVVQGTPVTMTLRLNGTEGNRTYMYNESANFTATADVIGVTVRMSIKKPDGGVIMVPAGNTTVSKVLALDMVGDWEITAWVDQPGYDTASASAVAKVLGVPTRVTIKLNDTEGNRNYGFGESANFTATVNVSGVTVRMNITKPDNSTEPTLSGTERVSTAKTLDMLGAWKIFAWIDQAGYEKSNSTAYAVVGDNETPQWSGQGQALSGLPGGSANYLWATVTDNALLASATLEANETGTWRDVSTMSLTGKSSFVNFTWQNASIPINTTVSWRIRVRDFSGNENVTDIMSFTIASEARPPAWSSQSQTTSSLTQGFTNILRAYWTDDALVAWAELWTNETTPWRPASTYATTYGSPILINAQNGWSNFTWQNANIAPGTVVGWRICANDTSGNSNCTSDMTFTVAAPPAYPINLSNVRTAVAARDSETQFTKGEPMFVRLNATNLGSSRSVLFVATARDPAGIPYISTSYSVTIAAGETALIAADQLKIIIGNATGTWKVRVAAYSDFPSAGGVVIGEPVEKSITVY